MLHRLTRQVQSLVSDGTVLNAKGEAWWHQELDLGLQIDFKLLTYTPASETLLSQLKQNFLHGL